MISPNKVRVSLTLPTYRLFTESQVVTHKDTKLYKPSLKNDFITRLSLRPPELMSCVDMVGKYYRWFHVTSN